MKEHADRLAHALTQTGLVQVINSTYREGFVSLIMRMVGQEPKWIELITKILKYEADRAESITWKIDISKPYMLRDQNLVYGWRISVQANLLAEALTEVIQIIKGDGPKPLLRGGELTEMPFTGMEGLKDRNQPTAKKKGATTVL